MKTNKGIDYSGPGTTCNRDTKTGIRYGIIPQNDASPEALDDIFTNGTDLGFEDYKQGVKDNLRKALSDYFHDYKRTSGNSPLDCAVENAFDAISDNLGDSYDGSDCARMELEQNGYKLMTDSSGDLWVMKSPFFTYAQFCSPCAPGACYLRNPVEPCESNKCYCLGADWFEDGKAPYPVYSVETGALVPAEA